MIAMPTYEYICKNCGHEFEQFQSITANALRKCSKCGKLSLKRLVGTGSGIIFKGSGFYQTDYRSEGYKKAEKEEKGSTTKTESEDKSKTKDAQSGKKPKPDTNKKKSA